MAEEPRSRPEKVPRPEKVAVVNEVRERLTSSNGALLTEYRGLKVGDLARLRLAVREAGGDYRVFKNTLARLACHELGIDELEPLFVGPTAVAFVDGDPVAVAKSLRDFARTNAHLTVKGGLLGRRVLTAAETTALADVAPREVVLAQLAGALAAPLQKMAGLLQALPRNFAYGLAALIEQKPVPEASIPAETTPAETSPAEPSPAEPSPAEPSPAEPSPAETPPTATLPAETEPASTTPPETSPPDASPVETPPTATLPAEASPADASSAEASPAEASPAEASPADASSAEARPAEARPAEARPAEANPAGPPSSAILPAETSPAETAPPADAPPAVTNAENAANTERAGES